MSGVCLVNLVDAEGTFMRQLRVPVLFSAGIPELPHIIQLVDGDVAILKGNVVPTTYVWKGLPIFAYEASDTKGEQNG